MIYVYLQVRYDVLQSHPELNPSFLMDQGRKKKRCGQSDSKDTRDIHIAMKLRMYPKLKM